MRGTHVPKASWMSSLSKNPSKITAIKQWLSSLYTRTTSEVKDWLSAKISKKQRQYLEKAMETAKQRRLKQKTFALIMMACISKLLPFLYTRYTMMVHWYVVGLIASIVCTGLISYICFVELKQAVHRCLSMARMGGWIGENSAFPRMAQWVVLTALTCIVLCAAIVLSYQYWGYVSIILANIASGWYSLSTMLPSSFASWMLFVFTCAMICYSVIIYAVMIYGCVYNVLDLIDGFFGLDWDYYRFQRDLPDVTKEALQCCQHGNATELKKILKDGICFDNPFSEREESQAYSILDAICLYGRDDLLSVVMEPKLQYHFNPVSTQEELLLAMISGNHDNLRDALTTIRDNENQISLNHLMFGLYCCLVRGDVDAISIVLNSKSNVQWLTRSDNPRQYNAVYERGVGYMDFKSIWIEAYNGRQHHWMKNLLEQMADNPSENQKKCVHILWPWLMSKEVWNLGIRVRDHQRTIQLISLVIESCSVNVLESFVNVNKMLNASKDNHYYNWIRQYNDPTELRAKIYQLLITSLRRNANYLNIKEVRRIIKTCEESQCAELRSDFLRVRAKWLEKCCETNQPKLFNAFICEHPDLDWANTEAMAQHQIQTPRLLHTAIYHGHIDMVNCLLKLGVSSSYCVDDESWFGPKLLKVTNDTITPTYSGCPAKYAIVTSVMVGQFDITRLLSNSELSNSEGAEDFLNSLCDQSEETLVFEKICARIYFEKTITPKQLFIVVQCFWRMNSFNQSENQSLGDEFIDESMTVIRPVIHRKGARLMRKALQAVEINQDGLDEAFVEFNNPSVQQPPWFSRFQVDQVDSLYLEDHAKDRIKKITNASDQSWSLLAECISMNKKLYLQNQLNRGHDIHSHFWISQCWDWQHHITRWDEIIQCINEESVQRLDTRVMLCTHEATLWMLAQKAHTMIEVYGGSGLNTNASIAKLYRTDLKDFLRARGRHRNHVDYWLEALWEMRGNVALLKDTFEKLDYELKHAQESHLYKKIKHCVKLGEGRDVSVRKGSLHKFNLGHLARLTHVHGLNIHSEACGSWMDRIRLAIIPSLSAKKIGQDAILRVFSYLLPFDERLPFEKSKIIIQKGSDIEELSAEKLFEGPIVAHMKHDDEPDEPSLPRWSSCSIARGPRPSISICE